MAAQISEGFGFASVTLGEHFPRTLKISFVSKEKTEDAARRFFAGDFAQFGIVKMARAGLLAVFTFETAERCAAFSAQVEALTGKLYLKSCQKISLLVRKEEKVPSSAYRIEFNLADGARDFILRTWSELRRRANFSKEPDGLSIIISPMAPTDALWVGNELARIFGKEISTSGEVPTLSPAPLRADKIVSDPIVRPQAPSPVEAQKSGPKK